MAKSWSRRSCASVRSTLWSDGRYLQFTPETGNVLELPRQPQGRFVKTTHELLGAQSGTVKFGVDPSRGSILALLVQAPSLGERIDQGGLIGYLILALGGLALVIAVERIVVLGLAGRKVASQLKSSKARDDNPLGRVLLVAERNRNADRETLELKMGEAILTEAPKLSRALLFLKIISVVAPLMGLLGTVTGMINTFQAITLFGTGDPKLMAGGISQALVDDGPRSVGCDSYGAAPHRGVGPQQTDHPHPGGAERRDRGRACGGVGRSRDLLMAMVE